MAAPAPGRRIGPYEIIIQIGAGGMGEVYRARDHRLERDVAIKLLPVAFHADPERLRRFEQEAKAAGQLNHPNLLTIFDVGEDNGTPYIVSELLEGESLRDRLRGGPVPIRKAIDYASQIARGLATAHDKGIVHRDLKPDNIYLTKDGRAKILDFGLAKLNPKNPADVDATLHIDATIHNSTTPGVVLGTVGYMSPEQVRGEPADARSDLFAFGAILYEMISGKRAFHGDTPAESMSSILRDEPPDLTETNRNVAPALERIVRHCLEKRPEERFQSARDVAFYLDALSGISTPSSSQPLPSIQPKPHWKTWAAFAIALLAVAAIAAGVTASVNKPAQPKFQQLTFRHGYVSDARFAPDGQTALYAARWDGGGFKLYSVRTTSPESSELGNDGANLLAVSANGEMSLAMRCKPSAAGACAGTLGRVPIAGGAAREIVDNVVYADFSPDANFATVQVSGGTWTIQYPPGKVLRTSNDHWFGHLRFSPNGKKIAFLEHPLGGDWGSVMVMDTDGQNAKTLASSFSSIQGLAWNPVTDEIWFTAARQGSNRLLQAVTTSGKTRPVLDVGTALILTDINKDGRVLLLRNNERSGIAGMGAGFGMEHDLSWFDWSLASAISPDGKKFAFSESGEAVRGANNIYLRGFDFSPAVHLAEGFPLAFSPDNKWVLSWNAPDNKAAQYFLVPVGAGDSRQITNDNLQHSLFTAGFVDDGKSIVFQAAETEHGPRIYTQPVSGGAANPLTPEGYTLRAVSLDGKQLVLFRPDNNTFFSMKLSDRNLVPVSGLEPDEVVTAFAPDGNLIVTDLPKAPAKVFKLNPADGSRKLLRELRPDDLAGVVGLRRYRQGPTDDSYIYSYARTVSDVLLVDGLK